MLVLNGGGEFMPGNEPQDRFLVAAATSGPAHVVTTALARHQPHLAARTAADWFNSLGLAMTELPIWTRAAAADERLTEMAREAGLIYLAGGDPQLLVEVLSASPAWHAMVEAWRSNCGLAGSSAGAMAICSHLLTRGVSPRRMDGLGLLRGVGVVPHHLPGALLPESSAGEIWLGLPERSAAAWDGQGWRALGEREVSVGAGEAGRAFPPGSRVLGLPAPGP